MGFYQLSVEERKILVHKIYNNLLNNLENKEEGFLLKYFADEDTYIRKKSYEAIGKIYFKFPILSDTIINLLKRLYYHEDEKIRQTVINAAGEIGKADFESIKILMDLGLRDEHHSVRNAVIGSIKKMGAPNPTPVIAWCQPYLRHEDKEIRREVCHGLELRGRTHPQDILPSLQILEFEKTARVRNTLIHVIGQIAYKKDCLPIVIAHLKEWNNQELVKLALEEIIDVHKRYARFAALSVEEATNYIQTHYKSI